MKMALYYVVPGLRDVAQRQYWAGALKLLPLIILALLSYRYLSLIGAITLFVFIMASHVYRSIHARYWWHIKQKVFNGRVEEKQKSPAELASLAKSPWWWMPVLNWNWMAIAAVVASVLALADNTQVSFTSLSDGWPVVVDFMDGLFHPQWSLLDEAIFTYARQTVEVALLGSVVGFVLALPISFLCAQNLMATGPVGRGCYFICRSIMVVLRAIPTFLLGLIFVALVGLGPFPGVLAITFFSMGVMVKLFSEAIESTDNQVAEAVYACGGNWVNMVAFGILPQAIPAIIAQFLYCVEINIHSATVLGLIGAEGIGLPIHEYLSALAYDRASVFILVTIVMTVVVDYSSAYIRKKII